LQFRVFLDAMMSAGVELREPKEVRPVFEPGIDYSDVEALEDVERRQFLLYELGDKTATIRALNDLRRHKYRRRGMLAPKPLFQPAWP